MIKPDSKSTIAATEALEEFNAARVHPELVDGKVPNPAGRDIQVAKQKIDTKMEAIEARRSRDAAVDRSIARLTKKTVDAEMATK